jgi:3-hydroxymyristoyl/3-hydroxydecanoyl-(acyl carrier protein) dehydratase
MDPQELKALAKLSRRELLYTPEPSHRTEIGRDAIMRVLPHRDPFLFVDEITGIGLKEQAVQARRRIDPDDPIFKGHFPDHPVYPGVLQLEMIGQLGLCLLHFVTTGSTTISPSVTPRNVRAVKVHYAQFFAPVGPGDEVTILCKSISFDDYVATYAGQLVSRGTICSFGVSEVYFVDE